MSVMVEIENSKNLSKARAIAGVNSDGKAIEIALEKFVMDHDKLPVKKKKRDLPQSYWDDLFSEPPIPSNVIIKAFEEEREDRF